MSKGQVPAFFRETDIEAKKEQVDIIRTSEMDSSPETFRSKI